MRRSVWKRLGWVIWAPLTKRVVLDNPVKVRVRQRRFGERV